MSVNNKRVFYVKYIAHPVFADILKTRGDVRLDRLENEHAEEIYAPVLAAAHAYQIGAARDELVPHFHVHADLIKRSPNLLIVSSNGAGFDPVDVDACTRAGVLVVNQSGGNAQSVAEHVVERQIRGARGHERRRCAGDPGHRARAVVQLCVHRPASESPALLFEAQKNPSGLVL